MRGIALRGALAGLVGGSVSFGLADAESWAMRSARNGFGDLDLRLTAAGYKAASGDPSKRAELSHAVQEAIRSSAASTTRGCTLQVKGREALAVVVPIALSSGFSFHRASGDEATLRYCALDHDPLPEAAHTSAAMGAVVLNDRGEVLLIRQHYDPRKEWRLPGGALDAHESFAEGAMREVLEETGVKTEEMGLLGFRHAGRHSSLFGKGFFGGTFLLRPSREYGSAVPVPAAQESEIEAVRWIPLEDALAAEGGMARSRFQRTAVVKAAVVCGFEERVPAEALRAAVVEGGLTPLCRRRHHPHGFPHEDESGDWWDSYW
jgi:ADP-ribose pyrophosphatase YjhB (NUDIX family)